jgi:glutamine synthetase
MGSGLSATLEGIEWVEIHYTDLVGKLRVVSIEHRGDLVASVDGSSIGVEPVESSDVLVIGDPETLVELPWSRGWGRVVGNVYRDRETLHVLDTRSVAKRVEEYSVEAFGLKPLVGVELEFFVFKKMVVRHSPPFYSSYKITPLDTTIRGVCKGYHAVNNTLQDYADTLTKMLVEHFKVNVKCHHHEVASSQLELAIEASTPLKVSDAVQTVKYVAKRVAEQEGFMVSFAPKPLPGENGSGMHIHISLWSGEGNAFYDPSDKHGLSQLARYFIGGLLHHARALSALVSPSVNSYRRLIPGYEAPVYAYWGYKNRSTCVRVPYATKASGVRVEFRPPDPSSNPYLAIAAVIMAGLDGVKKSIEPGDPLDVSAYSIVKVPREKRLPASLLEALEELEGDQEFLKPVFPRELIERYIEAKRAEYIEAVQHAAPLELLIYS